MRPAIQPPLKRSAMVEGLDMRCSNVKLLWNGFSPHSYPLVMVELSGLWMTTLHLHQPGYKYHLILCRYYDRYYVLHSLLWERRDNNEEKSQETKKRPVMSKARKKESKGKKAFEVSPFSLPSTPSKTLRSLSLEWAASRFLRPQVITQTQSKRSETVCRRDRREDWQEELSRFTDNQVIEGKPLHVSKDSITWQQTSCRA